MQGIFPRSPRLRVRLQCRLVQVHDRQPRKPRPGLRGNRLQSSNGGFRYAHSAILLSQHTAQRVSPLCRIWLAHRASLRPVLWRESQAYLNGRVRFSFSTASFPSARAVDGLANVSVLFRYGTDCYIHLSRLSQSSEPLQVCPLPLSLSCLTITDRALLTVIVLLYLVA